MDGISLENTRQLLKAAVPPLAWTAAAVGGLLLVESPAARGEDAHKLTSAEIKRLVTGKAVTDDVHYTDYFKAGGIYQGVFMNKRLTGTWKVKGDQLCVTRGSEPETCDEFWRSGSKLERRKQGLPNWRDNVTVLPN